MSQPLFIDDPELRQALDEAARRAIERLAEVLPEIEDASAAPLRRQLRAHLAALVSGKPGTAEQPERLPHLALGDDAFGDPFAVAELPLPRPGTGTGYAVQLLDTDTLLDRRSGRFLGVRDPHLEALFDSFSEARDAAKAWLKTSWQPDGREIPLAVVPAYFDDLMGRHVLIYGVLTRTP